MRTIIFSKDRPAQLSLLLESILKNDRTGIFGDIYIIYKASNDDFTRGYEIIKFYIQQKHLNFGMVSQKYFKSDLMPLIYRCQSNLITFLVDDVIIYRPITFYEYDVYRLFERYGSILACVSLRLGENTTFLYQQNKHMQMPNFERTNKFLVWNRLTCPANENFNYPLSLDGHIFRTNDVKEWLAPLIFENPNELEAHLHLHYAGKVGTIMACPHQSVLVNSPINRVQDQYRNKFGTVYSFTSEGLNEKFLDGCRIDLESIDVDSINASHQELEVKFK